MIRVTVELLSARTGKTSVLGRMWIFNRGGLGGSTEDQSNYDVIVQRRGVKSDLPPRKESAITRRGKVEDYPRLRLNMWRLIVRALLSAFPEEVKSIQKGKQ